LIRTDLIDEWKCRSRLEANATARKIDMRFEASMTLEEQVKVLATELERAQSELRATFEPQANPDFDDSRFHFIPSSASGSDQVEP
jgi:hypothetical protein